MSFRYVKPQGLLIDPQDGVERHTIEDWNEMGEFNWEIRDPDGFDRTDHLLRHRLFTIEQYERGSMGSTVGPNPAYKETHA